MTAKKREYSQAQNKATQKYVKNHYDEIKLRTEKGKKDKIKAFAEKQGESLNSFINRAIDETIERESKQQPFADFAAAEDGERGTAAADETHNTTADVCKLGRASDVAAVLSGFKASKV